MSDVAIKYNNETIGELNESGTATLTTSQKKCVSDIEIEYTKPSGGGINAIRIDFVNNTGSTAENVFTVDGELIVNDVLTFIDAVPTDGLTAYSFGYLNNNTGNYYWGIEIHTSGYDITTSNNVSCEKETGKDDIWTISYDGATNLAGQTVTIYIATASENNGDGK